MPAGKDGMKNGSGQFEVVHGSDCVHQVAPYMIPEVAWISLTFLEHPWNLGKLSTLQNQAPNPCGSRISPHTPEALLTPCHENVQTSHELSETEQVVSSDVDTADAHKSTKSAASSCMARLPNMTEFPAGFWITNRQPALLHQMLQKTHMMNPEKPRIIQIIPDISRYIYIYRYIEIIRNISR